MTSVAESVAALVRSRLAWALTAGFALLVWVQGSLLVEGPSLVEHVAFTVLPILLFVATVVLAARRRAWVAVGALMVAVTPTAWSSVAGGEVYGAMAVVGACAACMIVWWGRGDVGVALAAGLSLAVVGLVVWAAGVEPRIGDGPPWDAVVADTGDLLRAAVGSVGAPGGELPGSAVLLWWVATGLVAGAAVLGRDRRAAGWIVGGVGAFVLAAWSIELWSGPADADGGIWLLSAGIAAAGASVDLDPRSSRRLGGVVVGAGLVIFIGSLAGQIRIVAVPVPEPGDWAFWDWTLLTTSLAPGVVVGLALVSLGVIAAALWRAAAHLPRGVNVVGYLDAPSGLGERARELVAVLEAAGVPVGEWNVSAATTGAPTVHNTTIAVVTANQIPSVAERLPSVFAGADHVIGYWFWEVETVPDEHRWGIACVDEIWAPTEFVRHGYAAATDTPVRLVPLPIEQPVAAADDRAGVGLDPDVFTYLVAFDHASVMRRKNPRGAIEAFQRAFPVGDEPVALVIKTINADRHPAAAAELAEVARHDERVTVMNGQLDHDRHMALVREADALVSLHRSEGLGLHPADAMWLGTPVVATAYSGTLDLMDGDCAALVDYQLVAIGDTDGAYPSDGVWAEPDVDHAALQMRRLFDDPAFGAGLADRARRRMIEQGDRSAAADLVVAALSGWSAELAPPPRSDRVASVAPMQQGAP